MADPTNAKIRDGVQKPYQNIDGNELIELDDLSIGTGDPNFYKTTLTILSNWVNKRWTDQLAPSGFFEDAVEQIQSITFDDGTRTLTITPTGSTFSFHSQGTRYVKTGTAQTTIPPSEGLYYIYFAENGNFGYELNPGIDTLKHLFRFYAIVAIIYWDATNSKAIYFTGKNELHTINMDGSTHINLHFSSGTKYLQGCLLNNLPPYDSSGNEDSHAQFGVDEGRIQDEDIFLTRYAVGSTTGLPIYYLDGSNPYLRRQINAGFSVINTGTGRLAYNQKVGSTWQLTEVDNTKFVNYIIFAYNNITPGYCSFPGQNQYLTKNAAQEGGITEALTIVKGDFPIAEAIGIAVVTFQTSDSYGNAVKARIVDYHDITLSNVNSSLSINMNHNSLANVLLAAPTGIPRGHVDETLYALFVNPEQLHVYYFGEHGNNAKTGLTIERSVADPTTAKDLAVAQTPSATNRFTLVCADAGIYTAPTAINPWIDIYAPCAKFGANAMEIRDNVHVTIAHYDNGGTIGHIVWKSGTGISSLNCPLLNNKIQAVQGTYYVNTYQLIAPLTSDEYIEVFAGATLYIKAHRIKSKITVAATGTLYIDVDDSSEITENFAVGSIIYRTYKDRVNPSINIETGTFVLQPHHEHARCSNDGATAETTYQLPPLTSDMLSRGAIYFEVDSETYYLNIITDDTDTIRIGDSTNSKLRSKSIGNFVGLFARTENQWTVETIVGTWELISKV